MEINMIFTPEVFQIIGMITVAFFATIGFLTTLGSLIKFVKFVLGIKQ